MAPLVATYYHLVEYLGNLLHSLLSEVVLLRLIATPMVLDHVLGVVYGPQVLEVHSHPFTKADVLVLETGLDIDVGVAGEDIVVTLFGDFDQHFRGSLGIESGGTFIDDVDSGHKDD